MTRRRKRNTGNRGEARRGNDSSERISRYPRHRVTLTIRSRSLRYSLPLLKSKRTYDAHARGKYVHVLQGYTKVEAVRASIGHHDGKRRPGHEYPRRLETGEHLTSTFENRRQKYRQRATATLQINRSAEATNSIQNYRTSIRQHGPSSIDLGRKKKLKTRKTKQRINAKTTR